jgi:hypothetical protein
VRKMNDRSDIQLALRHALNPLLQGKAPAPS